MTSLNFGIEIQDDVIIRFSEMFRSLKSISWIGCYITDLAISVVVKNCPGLQSMKLAKCYNVTDASMLTISQYALELHTFHLIYNCEVTIEGYRSVLIKCSKLQHIGVSCCRKFDGTILAEIALRCANLRTLSIGSLRDVTEDHLIPFQGRCLHLKTLDFQPFPSVSGNAIAAVAEQYTDLQTLRLHLFGIKDISIKRIVDKCTQLKTLYLAGCRNITDSGILVVARNCPLLESIDLSHCKRVTDESCVALAESCPHLTSVSFSHCSYVTDIGVSALSTHCPDLTALHLSKCGFLCEHTFITAINRCAAKLISLELGGARVSPSVVVNISAQCTALQVLTLEHCAKLSLWSVREMCHSLCGLQMLQLLDNEWLTNDHVILIAESCSNLITLGISCKNVRRTFVLSAAAVEAIAANCRKLTYLGNCECSAGAWQVATAMAADGALRGVQMDLQLSPLSPNPLATIRSFLKW